MKAIFNTKSNYKNTNGKELEIVEINGTRITALVPDEQHEFVKVDFTIKEIVAFTQGQEFITYAGMNHK